MTSAVGVALAHGRTRLGAAGVATPGLDARLLLERACGLGPGTLLARLREPLEAAAAERYEELLRAREGRTPVAYLTGEKEFWSLRLAVDARVLVPRPETETLVEAALARLSPGARVADLGTGSGAVAIALAVELPQAVFWAVDRSDAALEVARVNALAHGVAGRITFLAGDLGFPLATLAGTLDAVVSNPPYVRSGDIAGLQPEVRDHEPRLALDGGRDGLALISRIAGQAPGLLRAGGWLLLEVGAGQAPAVCGLLAQGGAFEAVRVVPDLAGVGRVVAARRRS